MNPFRMTLLQCWRFSLLLISNECRASRRRTFRAIIGTTVLLFVFCLFHIIGVGLQRVKGDRLKYETKSKLGKAEVESIRPNDTWIRARQELLRHDDANNSVAKVVLYSYMRGGSTLFSNIFNIDPQSTMLWYEALDAFYAHYSGFSFYSNPLSLLYHRNLTLRSVDLGKRLAMTNYLEDLLNCKSDRLPIETLSHRFISASKALKRFWNCMKSLDASTFHLKRKVPASSCEEIESIAETELRVVSCHNVFRFLRNSEELVRKRAEDAFQSYFDQLEDKELRRSVYELCGDFWKLLIDDGKVEFLDEVTEGYEYDFQVTKNPPSDSERRCQTIQDKFVEFFYAARFTHYLDDITRSCREILNASCSKTNLVVAEIHRASMADLEPLVQRIPNVHVVFYVRDPRAVAVSRADPLTMQTFLTSGDWTAVNESQLLCRRMWDDLEVKKRLEKRYPGLILTVRYEDFLLDPRGTVTQMYGQFQRMVPEGFDQWVNETLNAGTYDGIYGIRRRNSMEHIARWRSKVSIEEEQAMTRHCLRVLESIGYQV